MFRPSSPVLSILFIVTALSGNQVPKEQSGESCSPFSQDSVVQNRTISAEQLKLKAEYMLTKVLGFDDLPNIVVSDVCPGAGVANGPLYLAMNNTLFLPLNAVRSLGNWPTIASALEPLFPKIRARVTPLDAMSDEMILVLLAHEMAHFKHRNELVQFNNAEITKTLVSILLVLGAAVVTGLVASSQARRKVSKEPSILIGGVAGLGVLQVLGWLNGHRILHSQKSYMTVEEAYADTYAIALLESKLPAEQAAQCFEALALWLESTHAVNESTKNAVKNCLQEQRGAADTRLERFKLWQFDKAYQNALWQIEKSDGHMPLKERCELFRSKAEKLR